MAKQPILPLCLTSLHLLLSLVTVMFGEGNTINSSLPSYCELWNAALCKPAEQSSTNKQGTANRAVDGNRIQIFNSKNCVHTSSSAGNDWWLVDLMDDYLVQRVVVTNRAQGYHWRIRYVYIELFLSNPKFDPGFPTNKGVLCTYIDTIFKGTKLFDCEVPAYARYVRILRKVKGHFNFCELEVMVSKKRGDLDCHMTIPKVFNVVKNTIVDNAVVKVTGIVDAPLACVEMCRKRGYLCNGCYWIQEKNECQLLEVNPYTLGNLVETTGTDFYIEPRIKCLGNGKWDYIY